MKNEIAEIVDKVLCDFSMRRGHSFAENELNEIVDLIADSVALAVPSIWVKEAKTQLTTGEPVPEDRSHIEIDPKTGQQKRYVVLSPEERAKGFIRPVRQLYTHKICGTDTRMGLAIAETYARDPKFYSGTFCCACGSHFPLGEFVWHGTEELVGS